MPPLGSVYFRCVACSLCVRLLRSLQHFVTAMLWRPHGSCSDAVVALKAIHPLKCL